MDEQPFVDDRGIIYKFGEFPPSIFSPLPYNDSDAQQYYPLDEQSAKKKGFFWARSEKPKFVTSISSDSVPDSIYEVGEDVIGQVIECTHKGQCLHNCPGAFKIVPQELDFYRRTRTPLPRLCPICRYMERLRSVRFKSENPIGLYTRVCQCTGTSSVNGIYQNVSTHAHGSSACQVQFQTAYAPDRPEIVYCESCYSSEVV